MDKQSDTPLAKEFHFQCDSLELYKFMTSPWYKKPFWFMLLILRQSKMSSSVFAIFIPMIIVLWLVYDF